MEKRITVTLSLSPDTELQLPVPIILPLLPGNDIYFLTPKAQRNRLPGLSFYFKRYTDGYVEIVMPRTERMFDHAGKVIYCERMSDLSGNGIRSVLIEEGNLPQDTPQEAIALGIKAKIILDLQTQDNKTIEISISKDNVGEYHGIELRFPQGTDFVKKIFCDNKKMLKFWEKFRDTCTHENMNCVGGYYDLYDCPDCGYAYAI